MRPQPERTRPHPALLRAATAGAQTPTRAMDTAVAAPARHYHHRPGRGDGTAPRPVATVLLRPTGAVAVGASA